MLKFKLQIKKMLEKKCQLWKGISCFLQAVFLKDSELSLDLSLFYCHPMLRRGCTREVILLVNNKILTMLKYCSLIKQTLIVARRKNPLLLRIFQVALRKLSLLMKSMEFSKIRPTIYSYITGSHLNGQKTKP